MYLHEPFLQRSLLVYIRNGSKKVGGYAYSSVVSSFRISYGVRRVIL